LSISSHSCCVDGSLEIAASVSDVVVGLGEFFLPQTGRFIQESCCFFFESSKGGKLEVVGVLEEIIVAIYFSDLLCKCTTWLLSDVESCAWVNNGYIDTEI
jgi:hypothetical protein